ncbi:MAG: ABC transporter permease subunit [Fimbriimonadaceae bacterium]|nr:ABC transporter permease subunit [Fimbriimonadaceae bacterium]
MLSVFYKELRDMFRDKRVRGTAFIGPIVLIFALMTLLSTVIGSIAKPGGIKVHVVNPDAAPAKLLKAGKLQVIPVKSVADGIKLVQDGKARVVIDFVSMTDGVTEARIRYDETEQLSQLAKDRVLGLLAESNQKTLNEFVRANAIPTAKIAPLQGKAENVGVKQAEGSGQFLVGILPYLIVIWAFYGGMTSASDLVAGEKERSTLETLLISPVPRAQIVLGKLGALAVICLLSSLSSLVGLALFVVIRPPGSNMVLEKGFGFTPVIAVEILALLIPLVLMFASLLIALSAYSKNSREAQTYLGLGSFIVIMPAMFSQFIGLTEFGKARWVDLVPVLNVANNIRQALLGKPDLSAMAVAFGVNLVIALVMAWVAVRLFEREEILGRG